MLSTTHLFSTAQSAAAFTVAPEFQQKMNLVRQFCFSHGLLGEHTKSVGRRGDQLSRQGRAGQRGPHRVRLRFDASYMQMAAAG